MSQDVIQVISAFAGAAGFALVFNIRIKHLLLASVGGLLSCVIYLLVQTSVENYFISCFVSSAFCAIYAEVMARIYKTPATVFFIPAVVALIPGGSLYYTMSYLIQGNSELFSQYGRTTGLYALGIACGISLAWALWYMIQKMITDIAKKIKEK
ncbi:MAG: threonine/serine exporter family protein [Clostridia bacterium]|nr:threonine/serine exporter family protein [Clostridia bacterium]